MCNLVAVCRCVFKKNSNDILNFRRNSCCVSFSCCVSSCAPRVIKITLCTEVCLSAFFEIHKILNISQKNCCVPFSCRVCHMWRRAAPSGLPESPCVFLLCTPCVLPCIGVCHRVRRVPPCVAVCILGGP